MEYTLYYWRYCKDCNQTILFQSRNHPDWRDEELAFCPDCKESLGAIKADFGCSVISKVAGNFGNGTDKDTFPDIFSLK